MSITTQRLIRKRRTRIKTIGTAERPRLSVAISNRHVKAQVIDDAKGVTLAFVTTTGKGAKGNLTAKAKWAGAEIATAAKAKKVKKVVLDRGSRLYQGRMNALAEAARAKGLEF